MICLSRMRGRLASTVLREEGDSNIPDPPDYDDRNNYVFLLRKLCADDISNQSFTNAD